MICTHAPHHTPTGTSLPALPIRLRLRPDAEVIQQVKSCRLTRDCFETIEVIGRGAFGEVQVVRHKVDAMRMHAVGPAGKIPCYQGQDTVLVTFWLLLSAASACLVDVALGSVTRGSASSFCAAPPVGRPASWARGSRILPNRCPNLVRRSTVVGLQRHGSSEKDRHYADGAPF